jgi:hypothetical protein
MPTLLQLQLWQGHPAVAQRSGEPRILCTCFLYCPHMNLQMILCSVLIFALSPTASSVTSKSSTRAAYQASPVQPKPPFQRHARCSRYCRHCHHHYHDAWRAHQVSPPDSKRQLSSCQVPPPPSPPPPPRPHVAAGTLDPPTAPSKSSARAASAACMCPLASQELIFRIKDPHHFRYKGTFATLLRDVRFHSSNFTTEMAH